MAKIKFISVFLLLVFVSVFAENGEVLKEMDGKHYFFPGINEWQVDSNQAACLKSFATDSFPGLDIQADLVKFGFDTLGAVLALKGEIDESDYVSGDILLVKSKGRTGEGMIDRNSFLPKIADKDFSLYGKRNNAGGLCFFDKEIFSEFKIYYPAIIGAIILAIAIFLTAGILKFEDDKRVLFAALIALVAALFVIGSTIISIFDIAPIIAILALIIAFIVLVVDFFTGKVVLLTIIFFVVLLISEGLMGASLCFAFGWRFGALVVILLAVAFAFGLFFRNKWTI